ncbi:sugar ABC transporter permease [Pararhizobium polonicum]|uniref:Autoinducer 2 import system permease protein LsrD n=1 Tax=Pararhizobium polonicum TaxID=1612624 RepID=A0A1C7NWR7_9HYPH|nr:ABC transporter permease [Pararhizobium polonicum]OBZ93465.1 sugar ABC transporter permease [Pararhizobium polonicum]
MTALSLLRKQPWLITLFVLIVLAVVNTTLQPSFVEPSVLQSNLTTFLPLILVAIGQTYVVLAGDIDLSVGSIVALANVVTATVISALDGSLAAIFAGMGAGLAVGIICGLINGLFISGLRFQPIVTTFATGIIFAGLAIWVMPQAGLPVPEAYWQTYSENVLGIPVVAWVLVAGIAFSLLVSRLPFHVHLLAVGGNRTGAFQTGLRLGGIRIGAYVISGCFAALAALCLTGETASGDPLLGASLALSSISAVVLGGTALSGGFGSSAGSIVGALVLGMIGNVIFFAGLSFEYQTLVQGLIVLTALAGGVFVTRR